MPGYREKIPWTSQLPGNGLQAHRLSQTNNVSLTRRKIFSNKLCLHLNPTHSGHNPMRLTQALAIFMWSGASQLLQAQAFTDVLLETQLNNNVSRSELPAEIREDETVTATVNSGLHRQPGTYTGLDLRAGLSRTLHRRYSGLSFHDLTAGASLTRKFGIGTEAPSLALDADIGRKLFNLDLRDAWYYRIGLRGSKRFADRMNLVLQLGYEKQDGDHNKPKILDTPPGGDAPPVIPGNPWSLDLFFLSLQSEYDLGERAWLSAGYRFQHGDVVSSTRSYPRVVAGATAITLDPVFGPGVIAYRLPADTHTVTLDYNRAVLGAGTFYLGIEQQDARATNGVAYKAQLFRAGFIYGF